MRTLIDTPWKAGLVKDFVVSFHVPDEYRWGEDGRGWENKAMENGMVKMLCDALKGMERLKFL